MTFADAVRQPLVEICVDDVAGAVLVEAAGADRIELCSALSEGGITPSLGLVQTVLAGIERIGLRVMVRPRGGNFVMSPDELDVMLADVVALRSLPRPPGLDFGFVFGALTPAGDIVVPALRRLLDACAGLPTTFHKAFDAVGDLPAALETLVALGVGRVGRPAGSHGRREAARPARRRAGRPAGVAPAAAAAAIAVGVRWRAAGRRHARLPPGRRDSDRSALGGQKIILLRPRMFLICS